MTKSFLKPRGITLLKVHFRHLAVNFLPQYFITLLFSLTCFLTITRRKRSKSGSKTRFQSDFCTLLIICVPPIILGQVLRYFPTVVAIHMNSYVTSYDPCADAIDWSAAKTKMAEMEHVERARVVTASHHMPQKERNQRTTLNAIEVE